MRQALARWRELNFSDKKRLLTMFILLPLISAMLRIFGFKRSHGLLLQLSQPKQFNDADSTALQAAERIALLANIAGRRGVLTATCLRQAMLVQWWLRREGLDARLKIGTRLQAGQFDAHAWVELKDQALAQDGHYHQPFDQL
jgi:hypothetical protein